MGTATNNEANLFFLKTNLSFSVKVYCVFSLSPHILQRRLEHSLNYQYSALHQLITKLYANAQLWILSSDILMLEPFQYFTKKGAKFSYKKNSNKNKA